MVQLDILRTTFAAAQMAFEAQSVVVYRLFGMAGLWSVTPSENSRMVSEKGPALLAAQQAAWDAAMHGQRPDQVYNAWLTPIGRKTSANAKRLGKLGLRKFV